MKRQWIAYVVIILNSFILLVFWFYLMDNAVLSSPGYIWVAGRDAPTISQVVPSSASNDLDTPAVIYGAGFTAILSGTQVITAPEAKLGVNVLPGTGWISSTQLTVTIPWGLEAGNYTLTVVNPDGGIGYLPNAFTVTQGIGVWTTGGPYGGNIFNLVVHPVTPTQIYASAMGSGLFYSSDGALNWRPILIDAVPWILAIDPQLPDLMYIGKGNDLVRSQDGGLTWVSKRPPISHAGYYFYPLAHPVISGTVYVGASSVEGSGSAEAGGVFKSDDQGVSWVTLGLTDTNVSVLAFHPENPDILYAGTAEGNVYTSTSAGVAWSWAYSFHVPIGWLEVNPFGSHEVWAVTAGQYNQILFKSLNTSLTEWVEVDFTDQPIWSLTFHPQISGTLWVATKLGNSTPGVYSVDGGTTWQSVGSGLPDVDDFIVAPDIYSTPTLTTTVLYAGTSWGVYRSLDGGATWAEANQGLAGLLPWALSVSSGDPYEVYASTGIGILKTGDGGNSWHRLNVAAPGLGAGWGANLAVDPFTSTRVYASGYQENAGGILLPAIRISQNAGQSWGTITFTVPSTMSSWNNGTNCITPDPGRPGHLLAGVTFESLVDYTRLGGLYSSDDAGETWTYLDTGIPIGPVYQITFDPEEPQIVYASTLSSEIENGEPLLKSLDGGLTWQALPTEGAGFLARNVMAIAVHPHDHTVYISPWGPDSGVYVSSDGGQTWSNTGLNGIVWALAFTDSTPPMLYASTGNAGLMRDNPSGGSWETIIGMEGSNVQSLAITRNGELAIIYVGASGGAITQPFIPSIESSKPLLRGSGVYRLSILQFIGYLPLMLK